MRKPNYDCIYVNSGINASMDSEDSFLYQVKDENSIFGMKSISKLHAYTM